jgi:transposase
MTAYKLVAIDTSKAVFTLHCVGQSDDQPILRLNLRRPRLVRLFKKLPPTEIIMEACGGAHHWARTLAPLGHTVRLIPPQGACHRT